jgi:hypothetical protein
VVEQGGDGEGEGDQGKQRNSVRGRRGARAGAYKRRRGRPARVFPSCCSLAFSLACPLPPVAAAATDDPCRVSPSASATVSVSGTGTATRCACMTRTRHPRSVVVAHRRSLPSASPCPARLVRSPMATATALLHPLSPPVRVACPMVMARRPPSRLHLHASLHCPSSPNSRRQTRRPGSCSVCLIGNCTRPTLNAYIRRPCRRADGRPRPCHVLLRACTPPQLELDICNHPGCRHRPCAGKLPKGPVTQIPRVPRPC